MRKDYLLMIVMAIFMLGCEKDETENPEPQEPGPSVQLMDHNTLGTILTDHEGRALYFFSRDYSTGSACEGGCLSAWPVFYATELTLGEGLEESDFSVITRGDGAQQTTYKSWPLYYFANDPNPGDVNGDGANDVWYVAKPDYSVMYVSAQLTGADEMEYIVNENGEYIAGSDRTFYITDALGRTLYAFKFDKNNVNNYTESDFSNDAVWPIFEVEPQIYPSVLDATDFGTIEVYGRSQMTYRGWPLYYFGSDTDRGDNKGVSVPNPGVWPIVNTDTPDAPVE